VHSISADQLARLPVLVRCWSHQSVLSPWDLTYRYTLGTTRSAAIPFPAPCDLVQRASRCSPGVDRVPFQQLPTGRGWREPRRRERNHRCSARRPAHVAGPCAAPSGTHRRQLADPWPPRGSSADKAVWQCSCSCAWRLVRRTSVAGNGECQVPWLGRSATHASPSATRGRRAAHLRLSTMLCAVWPANVRRSRGPHPTSGTKPAGDSHHR